VSVAAASDGSPNYAGLIVLGLVIFAGYVLYAYLKAHNRLPWASAAPAAGGFVRDPYARPGEIRHLMTTTPKPGRIPYARVDARHYLQTRDGESLLVIGGAGSGKTTGVLGPAVRAWDGPAVVVSTKPDLMAETASHRPHSFLVEPGASESQLPILGWSPLDAVREALQTLGPDQAWAESIRTADAMTAGVAFGDATESTFWRSATAGALAPLLYAASINPATDLPDLIGWVKRNEFTIPLSLLEKHRAGDQASYLLTGLASDDTSTQSRIAANLGVALQAYDDPVALASATLRGRFRPTMLLDPARPRATLYVLSDATTQRRNAPYFLALVDEVTRCWHQRARELTTVGSGSRQVPPERRLLLVFDDAGKAAALPDLDAFAAAGADDGITLALGAQDLTALRASLGEQKANAVVTNCRTRVLTRGMSDAATLQRVNELIGPAEIETSGAPGSPTTWRDVITVAELRELAPNRAIVVTGSEPLIRARLLDRTDFATAPARGDEVSASNVLPAPLPEQRWPFEPR
jgi:type IV secretion system protein VirD4